MFNNKKYTTWYDYIITQAKSQHRKKGDTYYEQHHIIPKSMGGTNKKDNLVLLTAREHYVCHLLLPKMCINSTHKAKMVYAFMRLAGALNQYRKPYAYTGKLYERMKSAYAKSISGKNCYMYGIPKTDIIKQKISATRLNEKTAAGVRNPMFGKHHSEESKQKMSETSKALMTEEKRQQMIAANPKSKIVRCHNNHLFMSLSEAGKFYKFVGLTAPRARITDGRWKYM